MFCKKTRRFWTKAATRCDAGPQKRAACGLDHPPDLHGAHWPFLVRSRFSHWDRDAGLLQPAGLPCRAIELAWRSKRTRTGDQTTVLHLARAVLHQGETVAAGWVLRLRGPWCLVLTFGTLHSGLRHSLLIGTCAVFRVMCLLTALADLAIYDARKNTAVDGRSRPIPVGGPSMMTDPKTK